MFAFNITGQYDATNTSGTVLAIEAHAKENFTASAQGTYWSFYTTPVGSTTQAETLRIENNGQVIVYQTLKVGSLAGVVKASGGVFSASATTADLPDSSNKRYVTDAQLTVIGNTSGTNTGDVAMATNSEVTTGTSTTKTVAPSTLAHSDYGKRIVEIQVTDPNGAALTTGDGKANFTVPLELNGYNLVGIAASVTTVSSSGLPTLQLANVTDGVDMLSTKVSIDASEFTSYTAATPAVIDTTKDDVATGDNLRIDADVAGTGAKGLSVILIFQLP